MRTYQAELVIKGNFIDVIFTFHRGLIDQLKSSIPSSRRRWIPDEKKWVVDLSCQDILCKLFESYGYKISIKSELSNDDMSWRAMTNQVIAIHYIMPGMDNYCNATDGTVIGTNLQWNVVIAKDALEKWNTKPKNCFELLEIKENASDAEVKRAYHKAALRWHPDINKDDSEMFLQVKMAYDKIKTETNRKNYAARLAVATKFTLSSTQMIYTPPKPCGILEFDGCWEYGITTIDTIRKWDKIIVDGKQMFVQYDNINHKLIKEWL